MTEGAENEREPPPPPLEGGGEAARVLPPPERNTELDDGVDEKLLPWEGATWDDSNDGERW